jgi:flavin reductase (DIM6/NTAB) family NADH-FMN oxidoreductase RutF
MNADAALRLLDREIWIVTSAAYSGPLAPRAEMSSRGGLVATSVSPASIDRERPVLLAGIAPIHFTAELIDASQAFTAHLLREDQWPLAWDFARDSGRNRDKLTDLCLLETRRVSEGPALESRRVSKGRAMESRRVSEGSDPSSSAAPILADCLAWFDCRVIGRYDAGDRLYFWGEVIASEQVSPGPPLRQQTFFRNLTEGQLAHLSACQQSDALALRPRHEAWRETIASAHADFPSVDAPDDC